jgi:quinol monooxygenase YgiN
MNVINSFVKTVEEVTKKQLDGPNKNNFLIGVGAAAGVIATLLLSSMCSRSSGNAIANVTHNNVWLLAVTLRFKTLEDKIEFREIFAPLATYVEKSEPTTLSYMLSESDKDPKQLFILERYTTKSAYLDVHKVSKEFKGFREVRALKSACGALYMPIIQCTV